MTVSLTDDGLRGDVIIDDLDLADSGGHDDDLAGVLDLSAGAVDEFLSCSPGGLIDHTRTVPSSEAVYSFSPITCTR